MKRALLRFKPCAYQGGYLGLNVDVSDHDRALLKNTGQVVGRKKIAASPKSDFKAISLRRVAGAALEDGAKVRITDMKIVRYLHRGDGRFKASPPTLACCRQINAVLGQ